MKTCRFVAATLGFLLFAVAPAHGQEPINRFSIGIGILTAPDWMDIFSDALLAGLSLGSYRMENRSTFGAIDAQYERFLSGRFAALGAAGFQRTTRDIIVSSEPRGSLTSTHAHLLGGASFHYLRGARVGLYSNASVGLALNRDAADVAGSPSTSETNLRPAFQLTLLGLRARRPFGAFLEFGIGYRGTVVAGVSYEY